MERENFFFFSPFFHFFLFSVFWKSEKEGIQFFFPKIKTKVSFEKLLLKKAFAKSFSNLKCMKKRNLEIFQLLKPPLSSLFLWVRCTFLYLLWPCYGKAFPGESTHFFDGLGQSRAKKWKYLYLFSLYGKKSIALLFR
jgi:hypothetical protein